MPSLTRDEAVARATAIRVDAYHLDFDLTSGDRVFRARSRIEFTVLAAGAETFIDIKPERLAGTRLDGRPLDAVVVAGRLALPPLAAGRHAVEVDAEMAYTNTGQGLHRFVDPADGETYVYAAMFLDEAPSVFACFDQPDLKAPYTMAVSVDPGWSAVANEAGTEVAPGRWEFVPTKPLATYFTVIAAGPWHRVESVHDGIPLGLYCRASLAGYLDEQADDLFAITAASFDRLHELFVVRYPFGKYDQLFAPEFTMGAMENPGCVTFRDEYVFTSAVTGDEHESRALTIAHEMAHMWFGDLVTMRWWDDLWLNESFAEYLGHVVGAGTFPDAWATFTINRKIWGYAADQRPSTHPVAPPHVPDADAALLNFDGISYAKGASVLRQLAAWLGFDAFVAGLRAHVATHAFGNATLDDLLAALGAASGRDLQPWSSAWLRTPEVSTLRPSVRAAGGRYEHVEIVQTGPGAAALRPHRLGVSLLTMRDGVCEATDSFSVDLLGASTPVPALAGVALPDLLLLNAGDLTYAKIRLDPVSLAALPRCLPYVPDPLTRSLLWGSAWDATRDGEMPATAFLDVVAAALPLEDNQAIFPAVLDYALDFAVDRFLAPGHRSPARHRLAVACRAALAAAPAGSGRQLTAARALIRCAGPADVGWLRAWLDDPSAPPRGLSVDTDLRWAVLAELCAHGAEVDIDAEYARDHTSTGAQHAARCRALVPTPAAKAAAWESIVADTTLSNKLVFAAASGFWRADQAELTAPYVARYAADMPDMVRHRPPQVAERTAELAYPRYSVDADSLATLTELAARPDLTPALRRALIDENDDLARSLNARNAL